MEKKGNRILPVAKGTAADSKKDGVSARQWPRGCRRREPSSNGLSTKSEPSRKPQPQRVKTIDKRPKPRSSYPLVDRAETTSLEPEHVAELGSVFSPGSKKQSLNHLFTFSYKSRGNCYQLDGGRDKGGRGKLITTKKHKYNKEHFLQANCQFIVNQSGDYKQYLNNPDALVDWDFVEQVNVQVSEFPSCPICLYPPVAAKMTRCGHIYCWSCILHYLALSDKSSRKCPICYEEIYKQNLKSVVAIPYSTFNVTETITFKLMKRPRGGLIAYPADAEVKEDNILFFTSEKEAQQIYSKLLLAKTEDILSIIARENKELTEQIQADQECAERCFIEQALKLLKDRENGILVKRQHCDEFGERVEHKSDLEIEKHMNELGITVDDGATDLESSTTDGQVSRCHYFYQASDGQHIYMHALNARMLEHTYGSLENGPRRVTGKIVEKEGGSMTEDLRKRLRYLQHLPVTCQFEVAEIQLKPPVIAKETLEYYHDQIETRRKHRQRRAKEEKRREKRIEVEVNRQMGKYPVPNLHLESNVQFPEFGTESRLRTESESTLPSERSASPDLYGASSSASLDCVHAGPSFATMLAMEKKKSPIWPGIQSPQSSKTPLNLINVTGSKMKSRISVRAPSDDEIEPEGYEHAPSFNKSFGDAVAKALEQAEKEEHRSTGKKEEKV